MAAMDISMDDHKMNFILQHEHSYSKAFYEQEPQPMETTPIDDNSTHQATPFLSSLTPDTDTIESILISLLRAHTQTIEGGALLPSNECEINPKSLTALSNEQINFLVTSSSVNYMAIQQILTQKSKQITPITNESIPSGSIDIGTDVPIKLQTPPITTPTQVLTPSSTLTITSQQLLELQSQLTALLQQQTVALGGQNSPPIDQQSLNNLLKQQLMNYVTTNSGGAPVISSSGGAPLISTSSSGGGIINEHATGDPQQLLYSSVMDPSTNSGTTTSGDHSNVLSTVEQVDSSTTVTQPTTTTHGKKKKDPDSKRVPTPFNIYFSDVYHSIHKEHPNLPFSDVSKIVSSMWNALGQEGKKKYYDKQDEIRQQNLLKSSSETPPTSSDPTAHSHNDPSSSDTSTVLTTPHKPDPPKRSRKASKDEGDRDSSSRKKVEGMCIANDCYNMAIYQEDRGQYYCSNECVVNYCRTAYSSWILDKKLKA